MIHELLRRRVPQIVIAYLVAGWGLVQFIEFLEERYALAPSWVDLTGLTVLLFVPAMLVVGWTHGAPGPDKFRRRQIVALSANVLAAAIILLGVFGHRDFGAVFETVTVENDDGTTTAVSRPRSTYRTSIADFPFELGADHMGEEWTRAGLAYLLELDLSQDPFLEVRSSFEHAEAARRAGIEDLSRIPRPLQRKIAQDTHTRYFLSGELDRIENDLVARYVIYDTDTGQEHAAGEVRSPDLFTLADKLSVEVRHGVDVSATSFSRSTDLPVADLATDSPEALRDFVLAVEATLWENDFPTAHAHLQDAVAADPTFAIAQFNLFATASNLNLPDEADAAMQAAMQNNYRLPERLQNLIKANYYFHREEEGRGISVLERWETVLPDDLLPKQLLAAQYTVRGRPDDAARMYESLLELNPSNGETWRDLGNLYLDQGDFEHALECYTHYTELYPESADGLVSLATGYELAGRLEEARATLDRAALLDPANLSIVVSLGDLQAKTGDFEAAERTFDDGLQRARTAQERASLLESYRSYCGARAQYERAIEIFGRWAEEAQQLYPPAQYQIILSVGYSIYGEAGRSDEGLERLARLEPQLSPPVDRFLAFGRGRLYLWAKRSEEARASIEEMQAVMEQFGLGNLQRVVTTSRARLAEIDGDFAEAVRFWRESIEGGRARTSQYVGLGRSLLADGHPKQAEETLTEGLRLYPSHGLANYTMALVQRDLKHDDRAREFLERALDSWAEADPSDEDVQAARAWSASLAQK